MPRTYSNSERAQLGGLARAKTIGKRRLKASARRAATIRWARYRDGLVTCPHCLGRGNVAAPAASRGPSLPTQDESAA